VEPIVGQSLPVFNLFLRFENDRNIILLLNIVKKKNVVITSNAQTEEGSITSEESLSIFPSYYDISNT
jgi:hypothetical protein